MQPSKPAASARRACSWRSRTTPAGGRSAGYTRSEIEPFASGGIGCRLGRVPKSFLLNDELHRYIVEHTTPFDDLRHRLVAETVALGGVSQMQVAPEQSVFLTLVARAVGARHAI